MTPVIQDIKISETETLEPSQNYQSLLHLHSLVPQESVASSEVKEGLPVESSRSPQHGRDALLYLQT